MTKESFEQIAVIDWLKLQYPDIYKCTFHIPNERKCTPAYGKILKRMGVKAGVSDLFIAHPISNYSGLFIEIKTLTGKLTTYQSNFINLMNSKGYYACVTFGFYDTIKIIKWYVTL
jgi:hypothetical protein